MNRKISDYCVAASIILIVQISCRADPWLDSPEKQKTLKHCAEVMLSSVDTNQMEWICSKISTNLPTVIRLENRATQNGPLAVTLVANEALISRIKKFSNHIGSDLNIYANQLTATNINTFSSQVGYCATISTPKGILYYNLWFNDGPIKYLNIRSVNGSIVNSAYFYENGKLREFRDNMSDNEECLFDANGKLNGYNWTTTNKVEVDINFDAIGGVKVRGFNLNK
jgi:hypothetical protein